MPMPILHEVHTVYSTDEANCYIVDCSITDIEDETERVDYYSRPEDPFGLNPTIRKWLVDNAGSYVVGVKPAPTPPTIEETRAKMPVLTSRQFWMAAANIDIDKDVLLTAIKANMPDSIDRKMMIAELESGSFERLNPTVIDLMELMAIPAEQVDDLWMWAAKL